MGFLTKAVSSHRAAVLCTFGELPQWCLSCTELSTAGWVDVLWNTSLVLRADTAWAGVARGGWTDVLFPSWYLWVVAPQWSSPQMRSDPMLSGVFRAESNKTCSWTTELGWITFWIKVKLNIMFYLWLCRWKLGLYKSSCLFPFLSDFRSHVCLYWLWWLSCLQQENCSHHFGWVFREVFGFFSIFFFFFWSVQLEWLWAPRLQVWLEKQTEAPAELSAAVPHPGVVGTVLCH